MDELTHYRAPFTIYVVWHPENKAGKIYAEAMYNAFCRNLSSPLMRALGIPVFFRFAPLPDTGVPLPLDVGESEYNAIVVLVEEQMTGDKIRWKPYIRELYQQSGGKSRLYPVAMDSFAMAFDPGQLNVSQFINLIGEEEMEAGIQELRSRLLHDFARLLYGIESVNEVDDLNTSPPVTLFISHAKVDGERLAIDFRDYINTHSKLKTFFDANDIRDASDFAKAIRTNVKNSAVVVFLSDQYTTREWCLIEVIVAKRNKSPLVVVNNLQKGERRSFPYLGNVPTMRYREGCFSEIVDLALYQALNNLYFQLKLNKEIELYQLSKKYRTYAIQNAPELFTYIDIKRITDELTAANDLKPVLVIYPDPPLGAEELKVLNDIDPHIDFITPSLFHTLN